MSKRQIKRPPPDFELAPLTEFDPEVLSQGPAELDGFILALALAYNDLKTLEWLHYQLVLARPKDERVSPYDGQRQGMEIHVTRMKLALAHELLVAIDKADRKRILNHKDVLFCVAQLGPTVSGDWASLVTSGTASEQKDPFRAWLVKVRNNAVSHYYNPKALIQGYRQHFFDDEKSPYNQFAFASLGDRLERSRFFFADAAVGAYYRQVLDPDGTQMAEASDQIKRVNAVLRGLVSKYLELRHIQIHGTAAKTRASTD